jgi:hypothetical protein
LGICTKLRADRVCGGREAVREKELKLYWDAEGYRDYIL